MEKKKDVTNQFYRVCYGLFIALAIYQLIFSKDYVDAGSSMGIALIFDPFNRSITWSDKPSWQRIWLISHLFIAMTILGYGIGRNFI